MACYVVTASEGRPTDTAMSERVWGVTLSLPAKVGRADRYNDERGDTAMRERVWGVTLPLPAKVGRADRYSYERGRSSLSLVRVPFSM